MTTGLTYSQYVTQIANLAVVDPNDTAFTTLLPQMITYAENRMYRDIDFLFTQQSVTGYTINQGSRQIIVPQGTFVTTQQINVITPAGAPNPDSATRNPLLPTTKEFLDSTYGVSGYFGLPVYYAPFNDNIFYVGPFSDNTYYVEIVGTYRPDSLSASNTTTFISLYLPDVFIMASMVFISGYQRNFGRQSDDPSMAQSYENQYQLLLKGSIVEEARKKYQSGGWTSMSPAVVATPTRG
jgi:hypothetical protein